VSIRKDALTWFQKNTPAMSGQVFASKYYLSEHAWPKQDSWWFEILLHRLRDNSTSIIHLLCQKSPQQNDFYHLKVPAEYFLSHLNELTRRDNGRVSIFPSAEQGKQFEDQRSKSHLCFRSFLVESTKAT
jgi:hypothetical protein